MAKFFCMIMSVSYVTWIYVNIETINSSGNDDRIIVKMAGSYLINYSCFWCRYDDYEKR
jgi:hypothetical protein